MAKHKHTILSMMKDEGHSVLEWVAFHHLAGFDNIVVYTNDCSDHTDDILKRLAEMGCCQHFANDVPAGKRPQPNCLRLAEKNPEVIDSEWILPMDADEFVNIKCGDGTVRNLLAAIPDDTDAIAMTWRFYGSNNLTDWNPGLTIGAYTKAAPDHFPQGWGVKTMFRPFDGMRLGIHRPQMKGAKNNASMLRKFSTQKWVNGSGQPLPSSFTLSGWCSNKRTLGYDLVEMNHYAVKSYESYMLRNIRGNVNNKEDKYSAAYFARFDRNEVENTSVSRFVERTQQLVDVFLRDPELSNYHKKSISYHSDAIQHIRLKPTYTAEIEALQLAGTTNIADAASVHFYHHFPKDIRDQIKAMIDADLPSDEITDFIDSQNTRDKLLERQRAKRIRDIGENLS